MCTDCMTKGALASVFAGVALTLLVSAAATLWGKPALSSDWMATARIFLKFAVGVFFFGLAKWQMWQAMQKHEPQKKK